MKILLTDSYDEMSRRAAKIFAAQLTLKPDSVLGLATGSTPLGLYAELARLCAAGELNFSKARSVNLDEYVGLSASHPQSYRHFMDENLFSRVNIARENTYVPDGTAKDLAAACSGYDKRIRELGGIDLQLLGLGHDGHIGFNEPGDCFVPGTHVVALTERTIDANARFFAAREEVPRQAVTMGIGQILQARRIVLLVSGADKAEILYKAVRGPVTPRVPASVLQLHADVTLLGDRAALEKLI